ASSIAVAVGVTRAQPDMPLDAAEAIDEARGALRGAVRRQMQFAAGQQPRQSGEHLAAEQGFDDAGGEEVAAAGSAPLIVFDAAVGDQRMDVWMQGERSRPGME